MKKVKFECIQQLLDDEICFDAKALLMSLEAYLGRQEMVKALEYITRVEDWRMQVDEDGQIYDSEENDEE